MKHTINIPGRDTPVRRVCKICGDFEDEHHEADYLEIPEGCVCDWRTWGYGNKTALPPACPEYKGDGKENCQTCEHDQACHALNASHQAPAALDAATPQDASSRLPACDCSHSEL